MSNGQMVSNEFGVAVLTAVFIAAQHAVIMRGLSSFVSSLNDPFWFFNGWMVQFCYSLKPMVFLKSAYALSTGDGALDEELGLVTIEAIKIYVYLVTSFFCWNMFGVWGWTFLFAKIAFHIIWPVALAAMISSYSTVARGVLLTLLDLFLKMSKEGLYFLIRFSYRSAQWLYHVATVAWDGTGLFIDIVPEDRNLPAYVYQPLDTNRIRLLKLSRRYPWGPMKCELEHHSVDTCPEYEAISYHWGVPFKDHVIVIDGKTLAVTNNAFQILRGRASYWTPRRVWIDSVCINQSHNEEKGSQIQMMKDIYRQSTRALVCLGDASDAFTAMIFLVHVYSRITWSQLSDEELKTILQIGTQAPGWRALFNLLENPYWRRIWVMQEIAIAAKVHLYYGGFIFTWETLARVMNSLHGQRVGGLFILTSLDHAPKKLPIFGRDQILLIGFLRDEINRGAELPLSQSLASTARSEATDARDKVYALLGVTAPAVARTINPNYRISATKVFVEATAHIIRNEPRAFFPLHRAGIGHKRKTPGLPSWSPDWGTCSNTRYFWMDLEENRDPYKAAQGLSGTVELDEALESARVAGYQIDEIDVLGPYLEMPFDDASMDVVAIGMNSRKVFQSTIALVHDDGTTPYHNGQSRNEALWRTLMGDRQRTEYYRPANPSNGDSFESARKFMISNPFETPAAEYMEQLKAVYPELHGLQDDEITSFVESEDAKTRLFWGSAGNAFSGRRFAITKRGYFAMVPPLTERGDMICLIGGAQTPFLLRMGDSRLQLVGECYVHGIMDGEMADHRRQSQIYLLT